MEGFLFCPCLATKKRLYFKILKSFLKFKKFALVLQPKNACPCLATKKRLYFKILKSFLKFKKFLRVITYCRVQSLKSIFVIFVTADVKKTNVNYTLMQPGLLKERF